MSQPVLLIFHPYTSITFLSHSIAQPLRSIISKCKSLILCSVSHPVTIQHPNARLFTFAISPYAIQVYNARTNQHLHSFILMLINFFMQKFTSFSLSFLRCPHIYNARNNHYLHSHLHYLSICCPSFQCKN